MKKLSIAIFFALSLAALGVVFSDPVSAQGFADDLNSQLNATAGSSGATFAEARDPRLVAALIIRGALGILGIAFLAYTVYAGYIWMTAAGAEDKISEAKATIRRTTIGLAIILSAFSITTFVVNALRTDEGIPGQDGVRFQQQQEPFDAVERGQRQFLNTDGSRDR